jgi:hypothetical protein
MSEFTPVDESKKRPELEAIAKELGLAGVEKYQNKPTVIDAINRVNKGEDAATVDTELTPVVSTPADDADKATPSEDTETTTDADGKRVAYAANGGHPRKFDATGNPIYRAEDI